MLVVIAQVDLMERVAAMYADALQAPDTASLNLAPATAFAQKVMATIAARSERSTATSAIWNVAAGAPLRPGEILRHTSCCAVRCVNPLVHPAVRVWAMSSVLSRVSLFALWLLVEGM